MYPGRILFIFSFELRGGRGGGEEVKNCVIRGMNIDNYVVFWYNTNVIRGN